MKARIDLQIQLLERRDYLASVWQNPTNPFDVDRSELVTLVDALSVINQIQTRGVGPLPDYPDADSMMCDTNGDHWLTPVDALKVINVLQRFSDPLTMTAELASTSDPNRNGVVTIDSVMIKGQALRGATITVETSRAQHNPWNLDAVIDVDSSRSFEFPMSVLPGTNRIRFTATDPLGRSLVRELGIRRGDLVMDWNATALNVIREWTTTSDDPYQGRIVTSEPPRVARNLAMIHTAMFDAINAIEGGYRSYTSGYTVTGEDLSPEIAGAYAAFVVAANLYPDVDELAYWNATLSESLSGVRNGPIRVRSEAFGRSVGQAMLASRQDDGSDQLANYTSGSDPGDWNRTLPDFLPALLPQWPHVDPFVIESVVEFRPDQPPPMDSAAYAVAVDEVMTLGGLGSTGRTDDQTEIAVFWADGGGSYTPPGHWNEIAASVVSGRSQPLLESARLFALLNLALADAGISAWDTKYAYSFWRPVDAIRMADSDGNLQTTSDQSWLPLLRTPPFPTYTSGHSTFSGAADAVLTALLGDDVAFDDQIDTHGALGQRPLDPKEIVTRHFDSFAAAAEESGVSRIYGGIHFSFDNIAGLDAGRAIGNRVVESALSPVEPHTTD